MLQALIDTLNLNSVGPLLMAKHFAPLLQKGQGQFGSCDKHQVSGVLVNMSAKVGSITDNGKCPKSKYFIQNDKSIVKIKVSGYQEKSIEYLKLSPVELVNLNAERYCHVWSVTV